MPVVEVVLPVRPQAAFDYLADPRNRPQWQSSLRSIAGLDLPDGDPTAVDVTWTDVTTVPGIRPRMRTVASVPGERWAEVGEFGRVRAELDLTFDSHPDGTLLRARFTVRGLGIGRVVERVAVPAIRADLRSAAARIRALGHD